MPAASAMSSMVVACTPRSAKSSEAASTSARRVSAFLRSRMPIATPPRGMPETPWAESKVSVPASWRIGVVSMTGPDLSDMTTPPEPDEDDMDFRAIVDEVLAGYFRQYPVQATEIGHHA